MEKLGNISTINSTSTFPYVMQEMVENAFALQIQNKYDFCSYK